MVDRKLCKLCTICRSPLAYVIFYNFGREQVTSGQLAPNLHAKFSLEHGRNGSLPNCQHFR